MTPASATLGRALLYSTCWEDVSIARAALRIPTGGTVVAIGAAGDNVLALLLDDPARLIAVDVNPTQLALLELKAAAVKQAGLAADLDVARFIGAGGAGGRAATARIADYDRLRPVLSSAAAALWDRNLPAIERGVIHAGRFERHIALFRQLVVPLVPGRAAVRALLAAPSTDAQREIYRSRWDSAAWRLLFRVSFSRRMLGLLGRDTAFFRHAPDLDVGAHFLGRARIGLTSTPIAHNPYVTFALTGAYVYPAAVPDYLKRDNWPTLAPRVERIETRCARLIDVLRELPDRSVDSFYLSDVFELADETEYLATLGEVRRVGRPGARVCYWSNLVEHSRTDADLPGLARHQALGDELLRADRAFLYSRFTVEEVRDWAARDERRVA